MPSHSERSGASGAYLETVGKALALAGILLPAVGVLARVCAVLPDATIPSPIEIALAAPASTLAAIGFLSLLPILAYVPIYFFIAWLAPLSHSLENLPNEAQAIKKRGEIFRARREELKRDIDAMRAQGGEENASEEINKRLADLREEAAAIEKELDEFESRVADVERRMDSTGPMRIVKRMAESRHSRIIGWTVNILVFVPPLLMFPEFPVSLIQLFASIGASEMTMRLARRTGSLRFAHVWPGLTLLLVASGVASGLGGALGIEMRRYEFAEASAGGLRAGRYLHLGETGTVTLLKNCAESPPVVFA